MRTGLDVLDTEAELSSTEVRYISLYAAHCQMMQQTMYRLLQSGVCKGHTQYEVMSGSLKYCVMKGVYQDDFEGHVDEIEDLFYQTDSEDETDENEDETDDDKEEESEENEEEEGERAGQDVTGLDCSAETCGILWRECQEAEGAWETWEPDNRIHDLMRAYTNKALAKTAPELSRLKIE